MILVLHVHRSIHYLDILSYLASKIVVIMCFVHDLIVEVLLRFDIFHSLLSLNHKEVLHYLVPDYYILLSMND